MGKHARTMIALHTLHGFYVGFRIFLKTSDKNTRKEQMKNVLTTARLYHGNKNNIYRKVVSVMSFIVLYLITNTK